MSMIAHPLSDSAAMSNRAKNKRSPRTLSIGLQIRDLRRAKGFSTVLLAKAIGRSAGYINNIENDRSDVSVTALNAISEALGVHISWFFQSINIPEPEEAGFVVRRGNRRQLRLTGAGISEELLSPTLTGESQMIVSTFAPGAVTGTAPISTDAEMAGVVLSGTLNLNIDNKEFHLNKGDSFLVPKGASHKSENKSGDDSITLWVVTPPVY